MVAGCRAAEGFQGTSPSTNSIALLIRCSGWIVEKDLDAVLRDDELDPFDGESDLDIAGGGCEKSVQCLDGDGVVELVRVPGEPVDFQRLDDVDQQIGRRL